MRRYLLAGAALAAVTLPLAACATSKPPKLAVCDGKPKHRRDANPYGSVLPGAPVVVPASDGRHPDALPPPPPPPPPKTSAIAAPSYFASC